MTVQYFQIALMILVVAAIGCKAPSADTGASTRDFTYAIEFSTPVATASENEKYTLLFENEFESLPQLEQVKSLATDRSIRFEVRFNSVSALDDAQVRMRTIVEKLSRDYPELRIIERSQSEATARSSSTRWSRTPLG